MGVAVSNWRLAREVASRGMLGVVSGTGIDAVLARRLQQGDPEGVLREAIAAFPCPETARRAIDRYYVPGGKDPSRPCRTPPMFRLDASHEHLAFAALSAFVEVWLAKRGHGGRVGINLLDKIPLPNPVSIFGAMLAGVDYVLMGAGIPWQIPGIIDQLAAWERITMHLAVEGDRTSEGVGLVFDPSWVMSEAIPLKRPSFLVIVSSPVVAQTMLKRATGSIEGFVVEGPTAGGHNAPPRGKLQLTDGGEPIYGERDLIDLSRFRAFERPFWLAGGQGSPDSLERARAEGAAGIQVGTLFAFCKESGLDPELRRSVLAKVSAGNVHIFTDPLASPTGFPFKVIDLEDTLSREEDYQERKRVCDAGYLRRICILPDGSMGYRCPAEPVDHYVAKGGDPADTPGRKCLCNALLANAGLPQSRRGGELEGALLTAGDDFAPVAAMIREYSADYSAADALEYLRGFVTSK